VKIRYLCLLAIGGLLFSSCRAPLVSQPTTSFIPEADRQLTPSACKSSKFVTLRPGGSSISFPACASFKLGWEYGRLVQRKPVRILVEDGTNNFDKMPKPGQPFRGHGRYILYVSICCGSSGFVIRHSHGIARRKAATLSGTKSADWNSSKLYRLAWYAGGTFFVMGNVWKPHCEHGICTVTFNDGGWFRGLKSIDSYVHLAVFREN